MGRQPQTRALAALPAPRQETREAPRAAAGHTPRDGAGAASAAEEEALGTSGPSRRRRRLLPGAGSGWGGRLQTAANRLSLRVSTAITAGLSVRPPPPPLPDTPGRVGGRAYLTFR